MKCTKDAITIGGIICFSRSKKTAIRCSRKAKKVEIRVEMQTRLSSVDLQCVWLILSRRFAFHPEPPTCLAPSQALVVRPVLIQRSVSCVGVKLFCSFSYCAVMVNKYSLREHIYIYNKYIKNRKSCATTKQKFRRKYPNRPLISKNTILRLVMRFNETGSVIDRVRKQTRRILIEAKNLMRLVLRYTQVHASL